MGGGVSGINLATQNALHPLHSMSVDVNQSGQNCVPVQVQQLGTGTSASCKRVVIAEGENSAVPYCHCAYDPLRPVHRNDAAIAKEKVGILACLGHTCLDNGGSEPDGHEQ